MDLLNVKEQQEFQQVVEQKQMKDFMRLYSNLVSRCFDDCVNDFTSANLTTKESSCISKCSEKFLKHSERVGQRFQEQKYVFIIFEILSDRILTSQCYVDAKHAKEISDELRNTKIIGLEPSCTYLYTSICAFVVVLISE